MKSLLFIGGTSFFGKQAVIKLLATKQYDISILTRGHQQPQELVNKVTFIKCDRTNTKQLIAVLKNKKFDIIIDNIAFNADDVKNLLENVTTPEHYLLCSSAAVYPIWDSSHVWQEDEAVLDFVPNQDSYSNGKRAAEKQLLQFKNIPFSIYRPTVVEGPEDTSQRTAYFVKKICAQENFYIPENTTRQHVYSMDVAEAILQLVKLRPTNAAYNVGGDDKIKLDQYCRDIAQLLHKKPDFEVVPKEKFMQLQPKNFPPLFADTFFLSNALLKAKTEFKPTSIKEWLPITVKWTKEKYC